MTKWKVDRHVAIVKVEGWGGKSTPHKAYVAWCRRSCRRTANLLQQLDDETKMQARLKCASRECAMAELFERIGERQLKRSEIIQMMAELDLGRWQDWQLYVRPRLTVANPQARPFLYKVGNG